VVRHSLSIAVLALLLVALAVVAPAGLLPGDDAITRAIAGSGVDLAIVSRIASLTVWSALVLATVAGQWLVGMRRGAALLLLSVLSAELTSFVLKEIIARPRPAFGPIEDVGATASFPSNSVVRVAVTLGVLAIVAAWHRPRWRYPPPSSPSRSRSSSASPASPRASTGSPTSSPRTCWPGSGCWPRLTS
jgi:membrane-associated phospholipid phosphatase